QGPLMERIDIRQIELPSRDLDFDALACADRALQVQGLMLPPRWRHRILKLHPRDGWVFWPLGDREIRGCPMKIRVGYELIYDFPQPTPIIMVLGTHFTRASDVIVPDYLTTSPSVPITPYRDVCGNWCSRIVAPAGRMRLAADGVVRDSGLPDPVFSSAVQHAVEDLPTDTLVYLLGSRYCETDRLSDIAWKLFEHIPPGWARVHA